MSLLILQISITLFLIILIPIYWKNYGVQNFLWLSDVGLFLTFLALWMKSSLFISMAVIGILLVEIFWNIDFFVQLLSGRKLLGVSDYMFDPKKSKFLRDLSLFHIVMPVIWVWYLLKWHYDSRALPYQVILTMLVFIVTYFFTKPEENINWIFLPRARHWNGMPSWVWLIIMVIGYPLVVIWPVHLLLNYLYS